MCFPISCYPDWFSIRHLKKVICFFLLKERIGGVIKKKKEGTPESPSIYDPDRRRGAMGAAAAAPVPPNQREEATPPPVRSARSPASVAADFAMGGAAAAVAKTGAAPVERVKLLLQNQGEMLRRGTLTRPYEGIAHAFARVLREEGAAALWRGNQANVIRYFPTQVRRPPVPFSFPTSCHRLMCLDASCSSLPVNLHMALMRTVDQIFTKLTRNQIICMD